MKAYFMVMNEIEIKNAVSKARSVKFYCVA